MERIQLAVVASYDNKGINTTLLAKNLSQINGLTDTNNKEITVDTEIALPKSVRLTNTKYEIKKDGTVIINNKILPVEYQQVKYIESSGTQYIDTRISGVTNTDEFLLKASYEEIDNGSIFGWDYGNYYFDINLNHPGHSYSAEIAWLEIGGSDNPVCTPNVLEIGVIHEISARLSDNKLIVKVNDSKIGEYNPKSYSGDQKHGLFARFRNNEPRFYAKTKISEFRYWRNGRLIRNCIPCYSVTNVTDINGIERAKDTIGMYDIVNDQFYSNQGNGTFGYETEDGTYVAPKNN